MTNARVEFEEFITEVGVPLLCAVVKRRVGGSWAAPTSRELELSTPEDLPQFLELLDFTYSDERLVGSVCWFEDGSWGEIDSFNSDGIDTYYWCHRSRPEMPSFTNPL